MKRDWQTWTVLSMLGLALCGDAGADAASTGVLQIRVTDRTGAPFAGLGVRIDGTKMRTETDAHGVARFPNAPAGAVSASFFDVFELIDPNGQPLRGEAVLPSAALAWVQPGQVTQLSSRVEVQLGLAPGPNCASTPWAIVGVTEGGIVPFLAKGSVGRAGPCACKGFADDPLNDPPCPGTTVFATSEPPPAQLWSVVADTCLGENLACQIPIESAEASVFH